MFPELRLLSEYRELAKLRPPTVRLPFLGKVDISPFLEGRSYLLSAYSKTGKTELMIRVVLGWDRKILWITEESQRIWEDRAVGLAEGGENVTICHAMGLPLKDIGRVVDQTEWDVLVVDTVKVLQIVDENDSAEVMKKLQPLLARQQAQNKIAIFLHHTRKAGGLHGVGAAGSFAFTAAVDVSLFIDRYKKKNQRRLFGNGRIEQVEDIVYILEEGQMLVQKEVGNVSERLMEAMTGEWQSTKKLAGGLDPEPADAGKVLRVLAKQGRVERRPPMFEGALQGTTFYWRTNDI